MQTSKPTKRIIPINRKQTTEDMALSKMVGSSKRLTLTYIVLGIWVALAVFAILMDGDLYALAVYFASGLPLILGYLWSETSRPSIRDAAEIVKGIGMRPGNNYMSGYSGYGGYNSNYGNYGGYGGNNDYNGNNYNGNSDVNNQSQDININLDTNYNNVNSNANIISIFSDDASIELKINQSQLSTLKNMGYVDMIGNKYTFKKNLVGEIKSLISDKSPDPII